MSEVERLRKENEQYQKAIVRLKSEHKNIFEKRYRDGLREGMSLSFKLHPATRIMVVVLNVLYVVTLPVWALPRDLFLIWRNARDYETERDLLRSCLTGRRWISELFAEQYLFYTFDDDDQ